MKPIKWIEYDECTSTQLEAKRVSADQAAGEPFIVTCSQQTAGRGRGDHTWEQVDVAFLFTLALPKKDWSLEKTTWLPLAVALSAHKVFERDGVTKNPNEKIRVKWPNDLGRGDHAGEFRKFMGILVESSHNFWWIGVGLNLYSGKSLYASLFSNLSSALKFDRKRFVSEIFQELMLFEQQGIDLTFFWENAWFMPGDRILYEDMKNNPDPWSTGEVIGLGPYGELRVRSSAGENLNLFSGEVKKLRRIKNAL